MLKNPTQHSATPTNAPQALSEAELDSVSGGGVFHDIGMEWADDPFVRIEYPDVSWPKGGAQWWAQ